ncbi:uncharacterized protein LOC129615897 isoform X1 [Condylostylus longicornis]|uniref:uncharacterized protein LOC129615897 isoform X1 n=1 Tax=Condylostylus longicornis TaxID=2530218 RepID=UPI00244DF4DA|nr:uncharacterized protein LOC129615897 isoform X1 [Condylostylus longicornis]
MPHTYETNFDIKHIKYLAVIPRIILAFIPFQFTSKLLDACFVLFIVTPLVVAHWNSTWALIDHYGKFYIKPDYTFIFGFILHIIFAILKEFLHQIISKKSENNKKTYYQFIRTLLLKLYTYLFAWGVNMHWRGGWSILDNVTGTEMCSAFMQVFACTTLLICTKSMRNLSAPPTYIIIDSKNTMSNFPTMFRTKGSKEPGLYVLDCLFSVLIVGTLVVVAWRGVWVMLDLTLYPTSKALSGWGSLIIGYIIVTVTFATQPTIQWTCEKISGLCRIIVADLFLFISFLGTVNVWRGVWMLIDVYLYSDDHVFSCWLSHSVSFMLLILLNCSNSVLVRGVYIDCEEPNGECVVFPIQYVRLFFQKERLKKHKMYTDSQEEENLIYGNRKLNCNATIVKSGNNNLSNKMKNDNTSIFNDIKPI